MNVKVVVPPPQNIQIVNVNNNRAFTQVQKEGSLNNL
jgi:hypothetical protein